MLGLTAHWACCVSDQWQFAKEMGRKQVFEKPLSAEPGCVKRGGGAVRLMILRNVAMSTDLCTEEACVFMARDSCNLSWTFGRGGSTIS